MSDEIPPPLDHAALALFANKGRAGGPAVVPQAGNANGVKVRRILQITGDFAQKPWSALRIADFGCGEGVYAIEAGLRGAQVLAMDVRTERMRDGAACAARHGLDSVQFVEGDVRRASREELGTFDVVYLLGLLYHLDAPEVFSVLDRMAGLCSRLMVIDTLVSLTAETVVEWGERRFEGRRCREHDDGDPPEVRRRRLLRSIDSTFAFRFTRGSLLQALHAAGFTSVHECHVPFEPGKAEDRITLVALKGVPVRLSSYPWVNDKSEAEIERALPTLDHAPAAGRDGR